jgi:Uncharacterized conserved protein
MKNAHKQSSILIHASIETTWNALTNEHTLTQWYAPGSPWSIPNLKKGEKMLFTLIPNQHNQLTESLPMDLIIEEIIPYQEFSFSFDSQKEKISFILEKYPEGTLVSTNTLGYDESLANLKALLEGNALPYV